MLGRGFVRFDMRDARRMVVRVSREPGARVPDLLAPPDPGPVPDRSGEDDLKVRRRQQPPARTLVAALDVGSSKVCAMIAEPAEDGRLKILGTGQRESRGVKRGFIADMEKSEIAIREAVEQAERIAGTNIDQVFVGFSAGGLVSNVAGVEVAIGGRRITDDDIDALLDAGREEIDEAGRIILHAMPAFYTIDGVDGVKQPRGLHADKLAVDIHVVAADPPPVKNLDLCVRSAHLGVESDRRLAGRGGEGLSERRGARVGRGAGRAWRRGDQRLGVRGRHAGRPQVAGRSAAATSPTTSPPPSAPAAPRPSGSNASTARR